MRYRLRFIRLRVRRTVLTGAALLSLQACAATAPVGVAGRARRVPPPAGLLQAAANLVEFRWEVSGTPPTARFIDPLSARPVALSDSVVLDMAGIDSAWIWRAARDTSDHWQVLIRLSRGGAAEFGATSATHVGQRLAVIVDGRVSLMPLVSGALGSRALLATELSRPAADSLAARVNRMVVALQPFLPVLLHRPPSRQTSPD